jgi:hypothetical protein
MDLNEKLKLLKKYYNESNGGKTIRFRTLKHTFTSRNCPWFQKRKALRSNQNIKNLSTLTEKECLQKENGNTFLSCF